MTNKKSLALLGELHNEIRIEDNLENLLSMAVISKLTPTKFDELYKSPLAKIKDNLASIIQNDKKLNQLNSLESLLDKNLSAETLAETIYFIKDRNDLSQLANDCMHLYSYSRDRKIGAISTSQSVIEIVSRYLSDIKHLRVFDGAAGICSLISQLNAKEIYLADKNRKIRNFGVNVLLLNNINAQYITINSLTEHKQSINADLVVTQPPWGLRLSSEQQYTISKNEYLLCGRDGKIPVSAADSLWIQHAIYHTNDKGKIITIMPQGWLFRGGYDAELREYLLEHDYVQAIIALPAGLMQHTSIQSVILVLNKNKEKKDQGVVHFVDANDFGKHENRKKILTEDDIDLIVKLAKGDIKEHKYYRSVLLPEIYQNKNDLNIKRYIQEKIEFTLPDASEELVKYKKIEKQYQKSQSALIKLLNDINS